MNILDLAKQTLALAEKATPGPWEYSPNGGGYHFVTTPFNQAWELDSGSAPFVAHSRTAAPQLADVILLLLAQMDSLVTAGENYHGLQRSVLGVELRKARALLARLEGG